MVPSYEESRVLILSHFAPCDLSPEEREWLRGERNLEELDTKPKEVKPSSSYCKRNSVQQRRRERENRSEGQYTQEEWESVKAKYGFKCLRCGSTEETLYPDHIVSLYKGGVNMIHNIQPLCRKCNFWKGFQKVNDFRPPEDRVDTFLLYNSEA